MDCTNNKISDKYLMKFIILIFLNKMLQFLRIIKMILIMFNFIFLKTVMNAVRTLLLQGKGNIYTSVKKYIREKCLAKEFNTRNYLKVLRKLYKNILVNLTHNWKAGDWIIYPTKLQSLIHEANKNSQFQVSYTT